jgi:thiosulfate reductase cytochrome b subunit
MKTTKSTTRLLMLYPLWLRIWHWINALLFLILVASGISLHFAGPEMSFLIPFGTARSLHNVSGLLLAGGYVAYLIYNVRSNNIRHYIPVWKGLFDRMIVQSLYYGVGIFKGAHHPIPPTEKQKFNPLQQLTYLAVMYGALPALILTGILLLVPELAPDQVLGMGGVWPVAIAHYLIGVGLAAFLISHVYIITTGETLSHNLKKMFHGLEEVTVEKEEAQNEKS